MKAGIVGAFVLVAAAYLAGQVDAECPKTHPFAVNGVTGDLSTLDKDVSLCPLWLIVVVTDMVRLFTLFS